MAEIDTPEKRQPYGTRARQVLSDLSFGKQARVVVQNVDRYGRTVGRVYGGDIDVNREMVHQGAAWVYRQYLRDRTLLEVEAEAKEAKRGLWSLPEAQQVPPWEWRRQGKKQRASPQIQKASQASTCGAKCYCKLMANCAEARFYLEQCELTRLDGDGDGMPCEALCR
ncbi:thermonuclease family protein [Nitrosococcus wardiae]|uniref:thermonuclease family protein n=1 Tax=Nitrosococcus wardiae TaxID=1814290 RepID=UPI001F0FB2F2|nr:thermonuclease family protein [Nitrosococcus wardiae]